MNSRSVKDGKRQRSYWEFNATLLEEGSRYCNGESQSEVKNQEETLMVIV